MSDKKPSRVLDLDAVVAAFPGWRVTIARPDHDVRAWRLQRNSNPAGVPRTLYVDEMPTTEEAIELLKLTAAEIEDGLTVQHSARKDYP